MTIRLLFLFIALTPVVSYYSFGESKQLIDIILIAYCIAWFIVLALQHEREYVKKRLNLLAKQVGLNVKKGSQFKVIDSLITQVERLERSVSTQIIEKKITSRKELNSVLEKIVESAYKQLRAESVELALFDSVSGTYHSSFVLGKPFRQSSQAMLSAGSILTKEDLDNDVLIQPISFAGTVLGSLRIALRKGEKSTATDKKVLSLLAINSSMALVNTEYNERLLAMQKQSDETIRAKTGFLANLSHEIRGPLNIILNAGELVLDGITGELNEDQTETLEMVRSNGQHLLELINDVLDYAKVEAGQVLPKAESIHVNELLADVTNVLRKEAEAKSHKLIYEENSEALAINCDKRHLRQMLINLLSNAIKYTEDGGEIKVWCDRAPGGEKIRLNVQDSGVGIKNSDKDRVFAAFERLEHSYSVRQVGAGLGMSLSKRLAEVNGGDIRFESEINKGSHFWLLFDSIPFKEIIEIAKEESRATSLGKGEKLLLCMQDDSETSMMKRYLSSSKYNLSHTSSVKELKEIIAKESIDLLILDNKILEEQNADILTEVRCGNRGAKVPVLLLSSRAFEFDVEDYLKKGVDVCMSKPVALKELALACRELIDGTYDQAFRLFESTVKNGKSEREKISDFDDTFH